MPLSLSRPKGNQSNTKNKIQCERDDDHKHPRRHHNIQIKCKNKKSKREPINPYIREESTCSKWNIKQKCIRPDVACKCGWFTCLSPWATFTRQSRGSMCVWSLEQREIHRQPSKQHCCVGTVWFNVSIATVLFSVVHFWIRSQLTDIFVNCEYTYLVHTTKIQVNPERHLFISCVVVDHQHSIWILNPSSIYFHTKVTLIAFPCSKQLLHIYKHTQFPSICKRTNSTVDGRKLNVWHRACFICLHDIFPMCVSRCVLAGH